MGSWLNFVSACGLWLFYLRFVSVFMDAYWIWILGFMVFAFQHGSSVMHMHTNGCRTLVIDICSSLSI